MPRLQQAVRQATALALLGLALALAACGARTVRDANFNRCLANARDCDQSQLTPAEEQQVFELRSRQHLQDCLAGLRCNEASLSEQERSEVREAVARLNFAACLRGEAGCRGDTLTGEERLEVERAARLRNVELCLSGLTGCDQTRLTQAELTAAREAYAQRNFAGCMNAVGTLVSCNIGDLSSEQRDLVTRRNLAVNAFLCTNSMFGCDEDLLTAEQRSSIGESRLPRR
jgi:hypothetical protein